MDEHIKLSGLVINFKKTKKRNFKLEKNNNFITIENCNMFLVNNPLILKRFHLKFVEHINIFLNRIQKLNPNIDLSLFYENLKTLSIKERKNFNKWIFITTKVKGTYDSKSNKIAVLKDDKVFSIYHELLHCASSKREGKNINTGFYSIRNNVSLGRFLNEGYTALLQERYFNETYNKGNYSFLNHIAFLLEIIVGKDKMENLYFNGNLDGLINELKTYNYENNIIMFINQLDFLHIMTEEEKENPYYQQVLYNMTYFLINSYKNKSNNQKNIEPSINKFISYFKEPIIINNKKYRFIKEDDYILGNGKIEKKYDEENNFYKYLK